MSVCICLCVTKIQLALQLLCRGESSQVQLLSTSFLYESPASYVTEQPHFVNAVCKVSTNLEPLKLLAVLKEVEQSVGRQESETLNLKTNP